MRVIFGMLLASALLVGGAALFMNATDGCVGRCGDGTRCDDHRCVPNAPAPAVATAAPAKERKRRRGGKPSSDGTAAPEVQLHPGDEKMVAQGDALGRPEHIDLTEGGGDGKELSQEDMDRVMRGAESAITRCITDAVGDAPLESAKVEVGMRVERGGQVTRVRVEGPALLQQKGLTKCVRGIVTGLHFPPSGGATVATYPYELK